MQALKPNASPLLRDAYGALSPASVLTAENLAQLNELRDAAVKAGKLPAPYFTSTKKELECLNLDIYDVQIFRGKVKGLVVQARTFWKHLRKGYTRSGKSYFLVIKAAGRIQVTELENATCAKRAKNTTRLGELVGHYQGKAAVKCNPVSSRARLGFKVVAKDEAGKLASAFDDSEYQVGKWRTQAARADHGGGLYYYKDEGLAIDATSRGHTFADSVSSGKRLVLCEVEVSGRDIAYDGGKWASSRLRIVRELGLVEILKASDF